MTEMAVTSSRSQDDDTVSLDAVAFDGDEMFERHTERVDYD